MMSSNVEQGRWRAATQPRRRRSERLEDDWRAVEGVGRFAGDASIGQRENRCVSDNPRRRFKWAGRNGADAHHAATGRRRGLVTGVSCSGLVIRGRSMRGAGVVIMSGIDHHFMRHRLMVMNGSGLTDMGLCGRRQTVGQRAVCQHKSGNRHDKAQGIERGKNPRCLHPHPTGQPHQHRFRPTAPVPNRQDAIRSQPRERRRYRLFRTAV